MSFCLSYKNKGVHSLKLWYNSLILNDKRLTRLWIVRIFYLGINMINEEIKRLSDECKLYNGWFCGNGNIENFAKLIVQECINKIETYRIPVGNSPAGELACDWTYDALKEIRDEIKEHFGVEE